MKLLAFLSLVFILACSTDKDSYDVFIYNQPNPITSLDPAFAKSQNNIWATHHLYNGLVTLDDQLNVIPEIAKDWVFEDEKTIVFNLKNEIYFHSNPCFGTDSTRMVNAYDVKYSLDRLLDNKVNSPGSWLFSDKVGQHQIFEVIDSFTFKINLRTPFMPILGILSMPYCYIVPKECVEFYGEEFRSNPVGTGPYKLKRWIEDQGLFLMKNKNYTLSNPGKIDYVKTEFITDKQIAFYELLTGNIDLISGLESSYVNELLTKEGDLKSEVQDKIQFTKAPFLNMEYLGINMKLAKDHPMLKQKSFRQALNYAIDKELMLKSLRNNIGRPAHSGFIPKGLPAHDSVKVVGYQYDLNKADSLLKLSNYKDEVITINTNNEYLDICTFIARQWESLGVKTNIEVKESAVLRDGMRKSIIPLFRASWIADYPDAESFLCMFYSKNPAPPNYTGFAHAEFDQLYEQSLIETDLTSRIDLYQAMDKIIIEEAPVIFLFYDESAVFYSKKITDYHNNALNMLNVSFNME